MTKYYNKDIPTEIHAVYCGRQSGKTYYELKKLKERIKELEEENKKLKEENERLSKNQRYYKNGVFSLENDKETMSDMIDDYKSRIDKAIEYIKSEYTITDDNLYLALYSSDGTLDKLEKILRGEE